MSPPEFCRGSRLDKLASSKDLFQKDMTASAMVMEPEKLIRQCCQVAGIDAANPEDPESLIGFVQHFRPRGEGIEAALNGLPRAEDFLNRLGTLYQLCGDPRRPDGGKDVYFIIRKPLPIDPADVETLVGHWITQMVDLAERLHHQEAVGLLRKIRRIRVLEGLPPKHPRNPEEWSPLLSGFQKILPGLTDGLIEIFPALGALRPACYYIACDPFLRDYFMWPLYEHALITGASLPSSDHALDPYRSYHQLWSHGVKYRIFEDDQIDLYIPRQS